MRGCVTTKFHTRKEFEEFFDAVIAWKSIARLVESLLRVHLDPFDHKVDVVRLAVSVKVYKSRENVEREFLNPYKSMMMMMMEREAIYQTGLSKSYAIKEKKKEPD